MPCWGGVGGFYVLRSFRGALRVVLVRFGLGLSWVSPVGGLVSLVRGLIVCTFYVGVFVGIVFLRAFLVLFPWGVFSVGALGE